MTFAAFEQDLRTIHAVAYNFGIIGEAANQMPAALRDRYPAVPWHEMRGMRNVVVHVYFGLSVSALWDTLKQDLPPLVALLRTMLAEE